MKTYLYSNIIKMSNDLIEYAYTNIKDIRNPNKLIKFPIFLNNKDCINLYRANYHTNSNNWTYKIIATKLCPFILEFQNGDKIKVTGYNQLKEIFKNEIYYKTINFTVYKGSTKCSECPFYECGKDCNIAFEKLLGIDCSKYNLTTLVINK